MTRSTPSPSPRHHPASPALLAPATHWQIPSSCSDALTCAKPRREMTIKMLSLIYRSKIRTSLAAPSHLPSLSFYLSLSLYICLLTTLCLCCCSHLSLSACSPQSVGGPSTNPRTHAMHCAALCCVCHTLATLLTKCATKCCRRSLVHKTNIQKQQQSNIIAKLLLLMLRVHLWLAYALFPTAQWCVVI